METVSGSDPRSPKCAHSIKEICESLGVSKGVIVSEIKRGKLPAKRLGRRLIVMDRDLTIYLEEAKA